MEKGGTLNIVLLKNLQKDKKCFLKKVEGDFSIIILEDLQ